jgi:hypothetical protein
MRRKNAQEIFGLLNKFSLSCVRSGVSSFSFCSSLSLSLTPQGINHPETIADDLNNRNLLLRSLELVISYRNKIKERQRANTQ